MAPGCGRFLLLSWGALGECWGQEVGGPGVQPSLSAVLPVLLGGLELLRSGESCIDTKEELEVSEFKHTTTDNTGDKQISPPNNKMIIYCYIPIYKYILYIKCVLIR